MDELVMTKQVYQFILFPVPALSRSCSRQTARFKNKQWPCLFGKMSSLRTMDAKRIVAWNPNTLATSDMANVTMHSVGLQEGDMSFFQGQRDHRRGGFLLFDYSGILNGW